MSKLKYKVSSPRGANVLLANPQKLGTPKDKRWATGRTVKEVYRGQDGILRNRPVEVWTCKCRDESGKIVEPYIGGSRKFAESWVKGIVQ